MLQNGIMSLDITARENEMWVCCFQLQSHTSAIISYFHSQCCKMKSSAMPTSDDPGERVILAPDNCCFPPLILALLVALVTLGL